MSQADDARLLAEQRAAFEAVVEQTMRDDGATEEQIEAARGNVTGTYVWARLRTTEAGAERTHRETSGSEPATIAGLRRLRRRLPGGKPGGAPAGRGLTWQKLVDEVAAYQSDWPPTQEELADQISWSVDRIRQVARSGGGWEEVLAEAGRRRR